MRQKMEDGAFIAAFLDSSEGGTASELLRVGRQKLKLVRWSKFVADPDLLQRVLGTEGCDEDLAEPCKAGEIDFFLSHRHDDDGKAKYDALSAVAERFYQQHGREPV